MRKKFLFPASILLLAFGLYFHGETFAEKAQKHEDHGAQSPVAMLTSVDLEIKPSEPKAGKETELIFSLKDADGKPLKGLTISHERILHAIIISSDFTVFAHIHPEDFGAVTSDMLKKAEFKVKYAFPKAGKYLMAVDYAVKGSGLSDSFMADVSGSPGMGSMIKDFSRKKKIGDYEITLSTKPEKIKAGKKTSLSYEIRKNGKKVTNLEPYLGAPMHIAVVMTDFNNFQHTHGEVPGASKHSSAGHEMHDVPAKFGPIIKASLIFPVKGEYVIFGEIKHNVKIIPIKFMVKVE